MTMTRTFLDSKPSLRTLAAFLTKTNDTRNLRSVHLQTQRISPLWWLEYGIDGLYRRKARDTRFTRYGDAYVEQDGQRVGELGRDTWLEHEVLRRLIAAADTLPHTTRVAILEIPFVTHVEGSTYSVSLGALVQATREEQSKARFEQLNATYAMDDLEKLLDANAGETKAVIPAAAPLPEIAETQRRSERIITMLGSPSRLYYLTLFALGLWLCFLYVLFVRYVLGA